MDEFIKIRYDIPIQCHRNNMEMKKLIICLSLTFYEISSPKKLDVLRGAFLGFGCPKRHPDALLAKTMIPPLIECAMVEPRT